MRIPGPAQTYGSIPLRRLSFVLILSLIVSLLAVGNRVVNKGEAATPPGGTVSPTNKTVTYTAGPFLVPNQTGNAGDPECNAVQPCDDFALTVSTPTGYFTGNNLKITVQWKNNDADFDVYLLNEEGDVLTFAATSANPELIIVPPSAGKYKVRVVPFLPMGESFTGTIALEQTATTPPPPPAPAGANRYTNYAAPASLGSRVDDAGEPTLGVNWKTGNVLYQSYTDTYRVNNFRPDGTAKWENKSARPPECTSAASLDPILYTDHQTGRTIESQLIVSPVINSLSCFTDNDGETWTPSQGGGPAQGVDHQGIGSGPYSPKETALPRLYPTIFYYCSQSVEYANCATSRDGGLTFPTTSPTFTPENCNLIGALHGHPKVAPDGTAYLPNKQCDDKQAVAVSENNGVSWTVRKVKGPSRLTGAVGQSDPSVGVGSDGTLYFGYQAQINDSDGKILGTQARIAVSRDKGVTWTDDQNIGSYYGLQNIVFPVVIAGDGDRAAFAFIGTTTPGDFENQGKFTGVWHLYIAHTYDRGKTWVTTDATPIDPVQRGCLLNGGGSSPCRNLLDFMDIDIDRTGRAYVGWADGCTRECATNASIDPKKGFRDSYASISRQSTGKTLFAAFDNDLKAAAVTARPTTQPGQFNLTATVANIGNTTANNVTVRFFDGATPIRDSAAQSVPVNGVKQFTIAYTPQGVRCGAVIKAVVDPTNQLRESNEANNTVQSTDRLTNDIVAPRGSIVINGGAASTTRTTVYLTLSATDPQPGCGLKSMRFRNRDSNGELLGFSAWEPYRTGPRAWFISDRKGTKTVYVQYMDAAGNVGPLSSDQIVLR